METLYIVVIIVFLIVLFWLLRNPKASCLSNLNGMWMADEEFCNESEIELMTVFFGNQPGSKSKLCWILIINKQGQYNHITTADLSGGDHIKGDQYEFDLTLKDVPDNIFSTDLKIKIVPGELITIVDSESDAKVFEGTKNKEASDAIEFNIE